MSTGPITKDPNISGVRFSPAEMPELYTKDHRNKINGLDWDFIRDRYLRTCSEEEREQQIASLERPMSDRVKSPLKVNGPTRAEAAAAAHPYRVSAEKRGIIVALYGIKNKVPWIATDQGVTEATVRAILREANVYDPERDRGRK